MKHSHSPAFSFWGAKEPGADSVVEGPLSEGQEDAAALPVGKDGREDPSWHPLWRVAPKRRAGARGSLSWDGMGGKKHDEEDDDKNNHADEDNHLHVLPPELPSHLLRCGLEVLRGGFQILCLVAEMFQVFSSG